ncbi:MAG: hypothetical protein ACXVC6_07460 [Bacteroidia bacterium]
MKLIHRISEILKTVLLSSGKKLFNEKTKAIKENTFQIIEGIKYDEYGNPDFIYK